MLGLLAACLIGCIPGTRLAPAGDSVIVTVTVADNAAPQPVAVDSVQVTTELVPLAVVDTLTIPNTVGADVARFAYPLSLWAPGQSLGGPVSVRLGRACDTGMCWSEWKQAGNAGSWAWGYTLDTAAPNIPEEGSFSISVGLN